MQILMNGKKKKSKPKPKFKINVTDMTTTFPCWSFDVEKFLERNLGETIKLNTSEKML